MRPEGSAGSLADLTGQFMICEITARALVSQVRNLTLTLNTFWGIDRP